MLGRPVTTGHVFVVASGFGKRVIPSAAPFTLCLRANNVLAVGIGHVLALVEADRSVADAAGCLVDVADVIEGPTSTEWWLETQPYRALMPEGWTAHASGFVDPSAFDLVGPSDSMIFIQTPHFVPALDSMAASGQEMIDRGSFSSGDWASFQYVVEGRPYVQRHAVVDIAGRAAVVTIQSPADVLPLVAAAHQLVAETLQPGEQ
jgi:hypothetical protein